jgi:hypothetical protein
LAKPLSKRELVVCLDERPVQLQGEKPKALQASPGKPRRYDYEYVRKGTANVFCVVEPLAGWTLGALSAFAAGASVAAIGGCFGDFDSDCSAVVSVSILGAILAGTSVGVALAGDWLDGRGSYLAALLGTVAGTLVAGAIMIAAFSGGNITQHTRIISGAALSLIPATGAMIAYEISSASNEND